jgi:thiamine kinase-like enzyme
VSALRQYHDAVADFRPARPSLSRLGESVLGPDDVWCHNDFAPYSVVHCDGLTGVIDWDIVAAAPPAWDLAFLAWQWVPLHNDRLSDELGAPSWGDRLRRMELLQAS